MTFAGTLPLLILLSSPFVHIWARLKREFEVFLNCANKFQKKHLPLKLKLEEAQPYPKSLRELWSSGTDKKKSFTSHSFFPVPSSSSLLTLYWETKLCYFSMLILKPNSSIIEFKFPALWEDMKLFLLLELGLSFEMRTFILSNKRLRFNNASSGLALAV